MQTNDQTVKKLANNLLNLRADLKAYLNKSEKIDDLETEQENIIKEAQKFEETAPALKKRRGVLFAEEQITGESDHSKEIAKLDIEISEAENYDRQTKQAITAAINQANEAIHGLQNVSEKHRQFIEEKRKKLAIVQDELLMKLVEAEQEKYQAAADSLRESAMNLAAFDAILAKNGVRTKSGVMPIYAQSLTIPAIGGMESNDHRGQYFSWITSLRAKPEQVNNLLSHLAAYGIEV